MTDTKSLYYSEIVKERVTYYAPYTFYSVSKRLIDIVGSIFLLILFAPLCLLTACAIKIDSLGPIYADIPGRVGKNGKLFKMYKFRSMIVDAHQMIREDPKFASLLEQYKKNSYKLFSDPRVTRVGRVIRRHSIDEIPQLVNVLRGEMSLVGPRAYYPDELSDQLKKYPNTRHSVAEVLSVRPGITGAWQVSGRSEINFDKRIAIDADYVQRKSLVYDFIILLKTPWAMISGKGAV